MRKVVLFGATGTIGSAVRQALEARGIETVCPGRTDFTDLAQVMEGDAVISCLASRTGAPSDAWAVDHGANMRALEAAKTAGIQRFVLLSAICVQRPLLAFQQAKLAFEAELARSGIGYAVVRPTAFFKSLSGQAARVAAGKPFLVFGNGELTACKPISDRDLAAFLIRAAWDPEMEGRVLPIGGPGPALTPLDQGRMLFEAYGMAPKFRHVPVAVMNTIIGGLSLAGTVSHKARDKAELARIGRYYATESMLVLEDGQYSAKATPETGRDLLQDHYARLAAGEVSADLGAHAVF